MSFTGWFTKAVEKSGVPRVTPHDLRHTAASLAVWAGVNVKALQRMLGHASAAMTLDTYGPVRRRPRGRGQRDRSGTIGGKCGQNVGTGRLTTQTPSNRKGPELAIDTRSRPLPLRGSGGI
ncbi:tyrosine-type recombinase/integrase [Rhodococcus rhodnii]|uniref:tyrosine-type recombinase/integrase n=1 Tax=Rhodococcus rhodnii TaxID=38312 RepID=UPI0021005EFE|nr:tyrosine-type recombinase/integrase [Rhodococcus rhodnii]